MTPDEQRTVDTAILDGKLVDAVNAYRAATGATVADAKAYVDDRSASVGEETITPSDYANAMKLSQALSSAYGPRTYDLRHPAVRKRLKAASLAALLVGAIVVGGIVFVLVKTRGFGLFSIVRESYYPRVVLQIENDPNFQKELGTPIVVDDASVSCDYIEDTPVSSRADCNLPVRGPRESGDVHAQINDQGSFDAALFLHVGNRVIHEI